MNIFDLVFETKEVKNHHTTFDSIIIKVLYNSMFTYRISDFKLFF